LPGEVDEFKANLSKRLKALLDRESEKVKRYEKVSFWCEDESRFGCHTIARNKITLFGVKPIGNFQDNFQCFWLYGAVEPRQGRSFFYRPLAKIKNLTLGEESPSQYSPSQEN
jgi:hypothetical protein